MLNVANLGYSYADTSIPASAGQEARWTIPTAARSGRATATSAPTGRAAGDEPVRLQSGARDVEFSTDAPATRGDERFLVAVEHISADDLPKRRMGRVPAAHLG